MDEKIRNKIQLVRWTLTAIVLFPIQVYSWIEQKMLYLCIQRNLSLFLFNKLPPSLSAIALHKHNSSAINKAKIMSSLYKNTAWSVLLELEKIDKKTFLEILRNTPLPLVEDYLFLEPIFRRNSILEELGINSTVKPNDKATLDASPLNQLKIKCHIEELYELITFLGQSADPIYQYGDSKYCQQLFDGLSKTDQSRLILLAMCMGDKRASDVINNIYHGVKDSETLLSSLEPQDKDEIERISLQFLNRYAPIDIEADEINQELQKAVQLLEGLTVEEAFWVLIYGKLMKAAKWIEAVGKGEDEDFSQPRFTSMVIYDPPKKEKLNLITAMRQAKCIIHIHNHPESPNALFGASSHDRGFANYWKSYRPELSNKMKFFIVQQGRIIEYM